jgi:hypothetical protein
MNRKGCGCKGKQVETPKPTPTPEKPAKNGNRIRTFS